MMNKLNVLVLAAGKGSRFKNTHQMPKPLIDVHNKPMIQHVITSIHNSLAQYEVEFHLLVSESHVNMYPESLLELHTIHTIDHVTDGAATSTRYVFDLLPESSLDEPWLIADCDMVVSFKLDDINTSSIMVERQHWNPTSSYSVIDSNGQIIAVAEKQPISEYGNTGQYLWQTARLFCSAYDFYKQHNLTQCGEFYMAPLYNHAIQTGNVVTPVYITSCTSLGTPNDLQRYILNSNVNTLMIDLDGTLVDSERLHQTSFRCAISEQVEISPQIDMVLSNMSGATTSDKLMAITYIGIQIDHAKAVTDKNAQFAELLISEKNSLFNSSVVDVLHQLHCYGINIIIVTNAKYTDASHLMAAVGIQLDWVSLVTASDVPSSHRKPNMGIYDYAIRTHTTESDSVVVLEDTNTGVTSAKAAGLTVVKVQNTDDTVCILTQFLNVLGDHKKHEVHSA